GSGPRLWDKAMVADFRDTLRLDAQKELYDYWGELRGERRMPKRSEIDPVAIPRALPNIALVDLEGEGEAMRLRVRLLGTTLARRYGERTGRYLDEFQLGEAYADIYAAYADCANQRAPHASEGDYWTEDDRHFKVARLLLPLSEDGESVDTILAGLFTVDD
ncbi:MAG: PAS domain-containing protein, partial [Alphaproteobacteria bacterium]